MMAVERVRHGALDGKGLGSRLEACQISSATQVWSSERNQKRSCQLVCIYCGTESTCKFHRLLHDGEGLFVITDKPISYDTDCELFATPLLFKYNLQLIVQEVGQIWVPGRAL